MKFMIPLIETLPLAKEELMDHEYIPVGPLMPLRAYRPGSAEQLKGTIVIRPSISADGKEVRHAGKVYL